MSAPLVNVRLSKLSTSGALGRDLGGNVTRLDQDALRRHDLVGKPDSDRLGGGNLLAGEHDLLGAAERHLPDDALGAAGAGKQPERDFRQA